MVAVLKTTASNESQNASTSEDTSAVQTQSVPEGDFLKLLKNPGNA